MKALVTFILVATFVVICMAIFIFVFSTLPISTPRRYGHGRRHGCPSLYLFVSFPTFPATSRRRRSRGSSVTTCIVNGGSLPRLPRLPRLSRSVVMSVHTLGISLVGGILRMADLLVVESAVESSNNVTKEVLARSLTPPPARGAPRIKPL